MHVYHDVMDYDRIHMMSWIHSGVYDFGGGQESCTPIKDLGEDQGFS